MKTIVIEKIKKRVKELMVEEKREIEHLIIYIDNNQPEEVVAFAEKIRHHLEGIIQVQINIVKNKKDKTLEGLNILKDIVEDIEKAIKAKKDKRLHEDELRLLKEMRIMGSIIDK